MSINELLVSTPEHDLFINSSINEEGQSYTAQSVTLICLFGLVAFLAVTGNILVMVVVYTNQRLKNVAGCYIVNLAVADALTGLLIVPLTVQAFLRHEWALPLFMCRLLPFIETVTLSVSVFTLTISTIYVYQAIVLRSKNKQTTTLDKLNIFIIWLICIILSVPTAIGHKTNYVLILKNNVLKRVAVCVFGSGEFFWSVYSIYTLIVQYYSPILIIIFFLCVIGFKLRIIRPATNFTNDRGQINDQDREKVKYNQRSVSCINFNELH